MQTGIKLFDGLVSRFLAKPEVPAVTESEVGWSESLLYRSSDFPKYNPDELIGRKGHGIYRKMMQDEQIKAVVRFKRDAITSRDWYFICDDLDLTDEEKERREAIFKRAVCSMSGSWLDAMNGIMSAMYSGFSLTEKVFKAIDFRGSPVVGISRLRLRPYDTFYFHVDAHGNVEKVVQKYDGREQDIDLSRFVHYVQNPDYDEHYGSSELREAYRPWFSKDVTIKMMNIYLERMAGGFVWIAPRDGKSLTAGSAEYTALQRVLQNLHTIPAVILPGGVDLHVEHPTSTDAYERAISVHDKAIAKSLLVPNLMGISEQGATGSYSQSQTQLEAFLWTLDADATRLEEVLNEQLFRELGDLNFGDGQYPRFTFKPVSDAKKIEIVKIWKELVQAGAVQVSESDDAHMRELLDIPERPELDEATKPELTLNGAQVASVIDVAARVGKGELSQEAATTILVAAFPIDEATARKIVATEAKEPQPVIPPQPQGVAPADDNSGGQSDEEGEGEADPGKTIESTIVGRDRMKSCAHHHHKLRSASPEAFARAIQRVDFAVIGNKSESLVEDSAYVVADALGDAVERVVNDSASIGYDVDKVPGMKFNADELAAIKKAVMAGLKEAWVIGSEHSKRELRKASKEKFGRAHFELVDRALTDIAGNFFKARGHRITGDLSNAAQKVIQNTLLEGIKNSKPFSEVKMEIYSVLSKDGMLNVEDVARVLGLNPEDEEAAIRQTNARIQTIMRTSEFEAINEARYQYFSDPSLEGFVEALEYSAILDDRVTDLCASLDGMVMPTTDDTWSKFNPPNHFNCRSILIPVTAVDKWEPNPPPKGAEPQKGFGFDRAPTPLDRGRDLHVNPTINVTPPAVNITVQMPEQKDQVVNFTAEVPTAPAPVVQNIAPEQKEKQVELTLPDGRVIKGTVK